MEPTGQPHPDPVVPVGTRVLLVEDDPLTQAQLESVLLAAGCQVATCASVAEARIRLAGPAPELLVLDVVLPDGSGLDLAAWVSAEPALRQLPMLVLSGLPDDDLVSAALAAGATDLLRKPVEPPLLVHRVRFALEAARTAKELSASRDALADAQSVAELGSFQLEPTTGRLRGSAQLAALLGRAEDDPPRDRDALLAHVHPADQPRVARALTAPPTDATAGPTVIGLRLLTPAGRPRDAQLRVASGRRGVDTTGPVIGTLQDLTDRSRERAQPATHAPGLPGRAGFRATLTDRLASLGAEQQDAVLLLRVDRLADLRGPLGSTGVEQLVAAAAERLAGAARTAAGDWPAPLVLARDDADTLALLCGDVPDEEAGLDRARTALARLTDPLVVAGRSIAVQARAGVTLAPPAASGAEELLAQAAAALAHSIASADRVASFHGALDADRRRQAALRQDLGVALGDDALDLHFQPQVAADGRVAAIEALLRWHHPEQGWVPPLRFLPLAEQDGLIHELGGWILGRALATFAQLQRLGIAPRRVAVNLSAAQLSHPRLADQVRQALDDHQLDASHLELELTEQALLGGSADAAYNLADLRRIGVRLALDDLGTGHSSLPALVRLAPDVLKIDGAFIADLDRPDHQAVVAAAVGLARGLGAEVVAEGVETAAQRDHVLAAGCDRIQGYLAGRPLDAAGLSDRLRSARGR